MYFYITLTVVKVQIIGSHTTKVTLFEPKTLGMHTLFYSSYMGCQYKDLVFQYLLV